MHSFIRTWSSLSEPPLPASFMVLFGIADSYSTGPLRLQVKQGDFAESQETQERGEYLCFFIGRIQWPPGDLSFRIEEIQLVCGHLYRLQTSLFCAQYPSFQTASKYNLYYCRYTYLIS